MHRSTRIIIGIELMSLLLVGVADWVLANATLRQYVQAGILVLAIAAGVALLGWEKSRKTEHKLVSLALIISAVVFQIAWFTLMGIKLGFVANVYRFNLTSIVQVFLPLGLTIISMEILRGQMVARGRQVRGMAVMTTIVMILMQLVIILPIYLPLSAQSGCELALAVIPMVLTNILLTYVAFAYDYRANIAYRLIMELPVSLLPIYPDTTSELLAIFTMILVFVLLVGLVSRREWGERVPVAKTWKKTKRVLNDRQEKALQYVKYVGAGVVILGCIGFVGLVSGLFHYYILAIGSGSMEPNISRGDFVLVEKTDKYDEITEGEVLIYRHQGIVMVHRVSEVSYNGLKYQYKTKGDANMSEDVWVVEQGDVIGVAKGKIATLGYPTLWLNELLNGGK